MVVSRATLSTLSAPRARGPGRLRLGIRPVHLIHRRAPLHLLGSSSVCGSRQLTPRGEVSRQGKRLLTVSVRLEGPDVRLERLDHSVHSQVLGGARAEGWAGGAQVDDVEVQRVDRAVRVCNSEVLVGSEHELIVRVQCKWFMLTTY